MLHRRAFQEPISKAGAKTARARVEGHPLAALPAVQGCCRVPSVAGNGRAAGRIGGFAGALAKRVDEGRRQG